MKNKFIVLLIGTMLTIIVESKEVACCPQKQCCLPHWYERLYLQADALYWKATEDNLSFATKESDAISTIPYTASNSSESQKREELDFKWQPGIRLKVIIIPLANTGTLSLLGLII